MSASGTYVTGNELRSISPDLLDGQKNVDLLFLLDALKYKVGGAEKTRQLHAISVGKGLRKGVSSAISTDSNGNDSRALNDQWPRTADHVARVQFFLELNERVAGSSGRVLAEKTLKST